MLPETSRYLEPYLEAAAEYGAGFSALLWASPKTQRIRFKAIAQAYALDGRSVLDAGCGRADLLDYLLSHGARPHNYIGLEAVEPLALAAEQKYPGSRIIRADFVHRPLSLFVGADAIIFSGSLNTMDDATFYATLSHAWQAAAEAVVFNFLSSPLLAGKPYLFWRPADDVITFARGLNGDIEIFNGYMDGDCTLAIRRARGQSKANNPEIG